MNFVTVADNMPAQCETITGGHCETLPGEQVPIRLLLRHNSVQ